MSERLASLRKIHPVKIHPVRNGKNTECGILGKTLGREKAPTSGEMWEEWEEYGVWYIGENTGERKSTYIR